MLQHLRRRLDQPTTDLLNSFLFFSFFSFNRQTALHHHHRHYHHAQTAVLLHMGDKTEVAPDVVSVENSAAVGKSAERSRRQWRRRPASRPPPSSCFRVCSTRLVADAQLFSGAADAAAGRAGGRAPRAGQVGSRPPALRGALTASLPSHYHVVLQWARDGTPEHMDVYAVPANASAEKKRKTSTRPSWPASTPS